jgi:D-amino-acid dehydrogenase
MNRVVVIGGGIVGASAAYHLARENVSTILVDRRDEGRATSAGAGIVAPGTSLRDIGPFYELAQPAVSYYPELIAALAETGAGDTGYATCGKLFLAGNDEEAVRLAEIKTLFEQRRDSGMPNLGAMAYLDPQQTHELFPAVQDVARALWIPEAARVDGALLRDALTHAARHHGAEVLLGAASLMTEGERVSVVVVDGRVIEADAVIVAAGAWSNDLLAPTGIQLPMAPQKGQIIHFRLPGQDTTRWPILSWFGNQYILAFGPDRVVAGATREHGSGFDTRITGAGVKHVLDTALQRAPGLGDATIAEVRVGLRPYAEDNVPFIDTAPAAGKVVIATGHGPSGLQLGPYSGFLAARLATGQHPGIDLTSFRLDRPIQSYMEGTSS